MWQQIVLLHYCQGLSFRRIRCLLGQSHVWILRCHFRALQVLRHSLCVSQGSRGDGADAQFSAKGTAAYLTKSISR